MVGIDADGGGTNYLFGYREDFSLGSRIHHATGVKGWPTMIDPLPKDPRHSLIKIEYWADNPAFIRQNNIVTTSNGYSVAAFLDKASGGSTDITQAPFQGSSEYLADHAGNVRYVSGMDVKNVPQAYYRDVDGKDWRKLNTEALAHANIEPLGFSSDDSKVYLDSDEAGDRHCLVEHDLTSDQRRKLACDDRFDLSSVEYSFDGSRPIAATFAADKPLTKIIDAKDPDAQLLNALLASFSGQSVSIVSRTQDGSQAVVLVNSDRNPGDYYLFDRTTKNAQYLMAHNSWIDPEKQAEVRPITFKSRDGQELHGYLTLPRGREPKNLPLVMFPHDGPFDERDQWSWQPEPQMLASRGYAVLQVNFRGSSGRGNNFRSAGKFSWGTRLIDDITDGVNWTVAQGYADPKRLCIFGAGFGGYAALMSAVREPDLYKCAIGYAGVYDLKAMKDDSGNDRGRRFIGEMVGASDGDLLAQSPISHLDRLKASVMIAHGEEDTVAPFTQAKELRAALDKSHYPYNWLAKAGEWHGFFAEEDREELYREVLAFLDRNIGAAAVKNANAEAAADTPAPVALSN